MSQATNPFNDALINDSEIVSNITRREELNLSQSTVSIRVPKPSNYEESIILFIEWDFLHDNSTDNEYQKIKPLIQGMWQNGYLFNEGLEVISLPMLHQKLANASLPNTPKAKLDNFLIYIARQLNNDSESVILFLGDEFKRLYFKTRNEAEFYLKALITDGLINSNEYNGFLSVSLEPVKICG